jgi:hypothetical protein
MVQREDASVSRLFDGQFSVESVTFAVGNAPPDEGPITMAVLFRPQTTFTTATCFLLSGLNGATGIWGLLTDSGETVHGQRLRHRRPDVDRQRLVLAGRHQGHRRGDPAVPRQGHHQRDRLGASGRLGERGGRHRPDHEDRRR